MNNELSQEGVVMKEEKVVLKTEFITLNQLLKLVGVSANGAEAKYMILDGKVKVNGEVEIRRGKKIRVGDNIDVEGVLYKVEEE